MQLSALLVFLPLAVALPTAPDVEARGTTVCKYNRDKCLEKCKPSFNALLYPYCSSSCNAKYLWCKNEDNNGPITAANPLPTGMPVFNLPLPISNINATPSPTPTASSDD
ncbi:hypothetical protein CCMA1212_010409 [Trichoderma ghanense]|uniref:SSCRP protein n=1 Tax=Trichoderma ghanense TaxID=65468 RepID=A0ABY2GSE9_9HYPO